jgi:N-acetylglucosaminyldiphosphoundecaprenol N-acetyl-beta-D-mannosaminyltransferase
MLKNTIEKVNILGIPIAAVNMKEVVAFISSWIECGARTFVTVTGVHGIMESQSDRELKSIHSSAGMCVPDGVPTVWIGKLYGHRDMRRVYGPDLMLEMMRISSARGYTHFLFGGKEGVATLLKARLEQKFPGIRIVGTFSPPFRPMNEQEEERLGQMIENLFPDIIWVGLSTPKQEKWMAAHCGKLNARVMIGVGAAFDFHAGLVRQAPGWVQQCGLEWFFRMCMEPRRLWRRYFYNNPRFIVLMLCQLLKLKKYDLHNDYSKRRERHDN